MDTLRNGVMVVLATLLGACASSAQLDPAHVSDVRGALLSAEAVGAERHPKAQLHLRLAREQMIEADRLAREGDEASAQLLLERARADAELALQLVRTRDEQQRARQAWDSVKALQSDQP